ncbi:MAG: MFS transporter, partial [candidate division KSB1 bacterium]|nr:MFS transporter [candidate division KSB1 bacterium]
MIDSDTGGKEKPQYDRAFRRRRFANWFPLGLTYATFYMGRYNLYNANPELCKEFNWSNEQIGWVVTAGFWTYAISLLFNGPLTDKIGGKKAILIGAVGTLLMNLAIGLMLGLTGWPFKILMSLALMFAVNAYFQSFGAISIVKVNAQWFHVRERGVFGAIFGAMIQGGYWLAYGVGGIILTHLPLQYVFLIPSGAIALMALIDTFILKDTPVQAGFPELETHDASYGDVAPVNWGFIVKKIFTNPILVTIAAAEFCTGFVRSGILAWWTKYLDSFFHIGKDTTIFEFIAIGIPVAGILGGFVSGFMSDKVFGSRRPPVAFIFYCGQ